MNDTPLNPYATPASNPVRVVLRAATVEMLDNSQLFAWARTRMKGHFVVAIGMGLAYYALFFALTVLFSLAYEPLGNVATFLSAPLLLGLYASYLRLVREEQMEMGDLFSQFSKTLAGIALQFLMGLVIVLGFLLLIVPGIILSLELSLAWLVLIDDKCGPIEAMKRSRAMMRGHRKQLFFLGLRFMAWGLLCLPTLGLFAFWLLPVATTAYVRFYEQVRSAAPAQD